MKKLAYIFPFLMLSLSLLTSCEDIVEIDTREGVKQLVIDAFLTNESQSQTVKLSISQPYFDNSSPKPALGATVTVFDEDTVAYQFKDIKNNGSYVWQPKAGEALNKANKRYALHIKYDGEEYVSLSQLKRVPKTDSLVYEEEDLPIQPTDGSPQNGFVAQFYARDPTGEGDAYWIRTKKNHKYIDKSNSLSLAYDAGFSPNAQNDGFIFILPIRRSITRDLYQDKDTLSVELYGITPETYFFLSQARTESSNVGLFARTPNNVPTNIVNQNEKSTKKALGFFSVMAVNKLETIIDKAKAKPKKK
jgi:hypothetical protein